MRIKIALSGYTDRAKDSFSLGGGRPRLTSVSLINTITFVSQSFFSIICRQPIFYSVLPTIQAGCEYWLWPCQYLYPQRHNRYAGYHHQTQEYSRRERQLYPHPHVARMALRGQTPTRRRVSSNAPVHSNQIEQVLIGK